MRKLAILFFAFLWVATIAQAQFTPITNNLVSPGGVRVDAAGNYWVAESGTGLSYDGRVSVVKPNGDKTPVVVGLPSLLDTTTHEVTGPWQTYALPNNQLAVVVGGGPGRLFGRIYIFDMTGFSPFTSGVKRMSDTLRTIDVSGFEYGKGLPDSDPFRLAIDSAGVWYVTDAGSNNIVKITPDGTKTIFASFPPVKNPTPIGPPVVDAVPTGIVARPGGGFYVSTLTGFPFNKGAATVYTVDANGAVAPYLTGFTMLSDMALDKNTGSLYLLQYGSFAFAPFPGFVPGSGVVYRVNTTTKAVDTVGRNFGPGPGLALDAQGGVVVTSLVTGQLLKLNKSQTARLQIIHDAPTATVDLYLNGNIWLKSVAFRTATPFLEVPAGIANIGVARAGSASARDTFINIPLSLNASQWYIAVLNGVAGNTATPFNIALANMGKELSNTSGNVDIAFFNGSPDAPAVGVLNGTNAMFSNVAYKGFGPYVSVPAKPFTISMTGAPALGKYNVDLSFWKDKTAVIFNTGYVNGGGTAFQPWVALSNGGTFPLLATPSVQFSPVSALRASAGDVAVYPNPVSNELRVGYMARGGKDALLSLFNTTGVAVQTQRYEGTEQGWQETTLDVSKVPNGYYFLKLETSDGTLSTHKIVVFKN